VFEGFTMEYVDVGEVALRVRHGGHGQPVVLLHGHPRTHTTWHRVAPQLAGDVVSLMRHLGHERFAVVGHDRGSLAAFRTAMDHPRAVTRLVVMDGLPIVEHLERLNEGFVRTWWHWWFYGQTEKPAERVIDLDPDAWYRTPSPREMGQGNHADVWASLRDPAVVHGMCEDYRAGLRIDRAHEAIWRPWAAGKLDSAAVRSGHHQAEQAPDELAQALREFLASPTP
jgi:haloacetate dehalogenase